MLLAEPPAQPGRGVSVEESIGFRDRTKLEVVGPPTQLLIQISHHIAGIHPFHVPVCLDTHSLSHAPDALARRPGGDIRPPGFRRVALTKGVPQEVELLFRNAARSRLFFVHRQLQLAHQPPHGFQRLDGIVLLAADNQIVRVIDDLCAKPMLRAGPLPSQNEPPHVQIGQQR